MKGSKKLNKPNVPTNVSVFNPYSKYYNSKGMMKKVNTTKKTNSRGH